MPKDCRGGFSTNWTIKGQGARAALLIHCSLAHHGAWKGVVTALDSDLRMTMFDIPGHGKSDDWDERGNIQQVSLEMAKDLIDGPVDVVGHSFGATIALRLAIEAPHLVRSLTMIEPVFFAAISGSDDDILKQNEAEYLRTFELFDQGDAEAAAKMFSNSWGAGIAWQDLPAAQRAYMSERIHLVRCAESEIYDDKAGLLDKLSDMNVPTLIMDGTQSQPVMKLICDVLSSKIPHAKRIRIPGAGHMAPITHAGAVAANISEFLGLGP